MAADVYTFHVTYNELPDKIWRTIELSSRYPMDSLGYCILASFETLAYHLFSFEFKGQSFCIPSEWDQPNSKNRDMAAVRLEQLGLQSGDTIEIFYDFGTTQHFHLELKKICPMKKGTGTHYPYIIAGAGRGILDDYPAEKLAELIAQIDSYGKTENEIYYNESRVPWDYRDYSLDLDNILLKGRIQCIKEGYRPFWEK